MPKSKLNRVLFPDDFNDGNVVRKKNHITNTVTKNQTKKGERSRSTSAFVKNGKRVTEEDSCLARLAGPDLPVAISPASPSSSSSFKENERSIRQVQKRRRSKRNRMCVDEKQQQIDQHRSRNQYKNSQRPYYHYNTRASSGNKNSKEQSSAKQTMRRSRRVSTEAMDVLVNIGNIAINSLSIVSSNRQGENREKDQMEKKSQRQGKPKTKKNEKRRKNKKNVQKARRISLENEEQLRIAANENAIHCDGESPISPPIAPNRIDTIATNENVDCNEESPISPSIAPKPTKRIDMKNTPIHNESEGSQLHYDYEDNLDKIVWHGVSSTIRKKNNSKSHYQTEMKIEKETETELAIETKHNVISNNTLHTKNEERNNCIDSNLKYEKNDPKGTRRSTRNKNPVDRLTMGHKSRKKKRSTSVLKKEKTKDEKNHHFEKDTSIEQKEKNINIDKPKNAAIVIQKNGDITPNCHTETLSTSQSSKETDWDDALLKLLKNAHKKTDPKCPSFWQQISSKVPHKSAEQCRDKWFALANTPKARRKKSQKQALVINPNEDDEDDDIFNSTPNRNTAQILLLDLSSTSRKRRSRKRSSDNFSDILSSPIMKGSTSHFHETQKTLSPLKFQPMYKTYLNKVRACVNERKHERKLAQPTKFKTSQDRPKYLSAEIDAGDVHMNGMLSPNGTVMVDAPEEHEVEGMYLPSDYESSEEDTM